MGLWLLHHVELVVCVLELIVAATKLYLLTA